MNTEESKPTPPPPQKTSFFKWARTSLLTGIVVTAPIGITIYLTLAVISFVDDSVLPLVPDSYNPETYLPISVPGLGIVFTIIALTLLGALTTNLFGRRLIAFGERLVSRMPIIRVVYNTLKQIVETVVSDQSANFTDVGLIEYPRKGLYAICFVTTETGGEINDHVDDVLYSVFLPTTPNPTSGFLLFVPKSEIKILDMSVEEAAKLVISAGLVEPGRETVPAIDPEEIEKKTSGPIAAE